MNSNIPKDGPVDTCLSCGELIPLCNCVKPCGRCIRLLRALTLAKDELHRVGGCEGGGYDGYPHTGVCAEITKARGHA